MLKLIWTSMIIVETAAHLLIKQGTTVAGFSDLQPNLYLAGGYTLYVVAFFLWMQILRTTPLYVALAGASVIYVTIAYGAHFFLGEPLTAKSLAGTVMVAAGVYLVSYSRKRAEE
ncbi:hypothetical protein [Anaeroselena agilis]|uniref:Uncharacterized protein n=1 Tax=Anaeroselena agilis TaxID=3063788 RepID=A0ABU3NXV7_9FIRM|nr:hypothetical protein [Selenomonadales bacterium 4137-cl]